MKKRGGWKLSPETRARMAAGQARRNQKPEEKERRRQTALEGWQPGGFLRTAPVGRKGPPKNIRSIHKWVARHRARTGICERCGKEIPPVIDKLGRKHVGTVFANISGEYRLDVNDYKELCRSCHIIYDAEERDA